jgi:hypothetical protein
MAENVHAPKQSKKPSYKVHFDEKLRSGEVFWYNHREWLKSKGYVLRPRYQEGWTASWKATDKYLAETGWCTRRTKSTTITGLVFPATFNYFFQKLMAK